jgi:hypothetical protein
MGNKEGTCSTHLGKEKVNDDKHHTAGAYEDQEIFPVNAGKRGRSGLEDQEAA